MAAIVLNCQADITKIQSALHAAKREVLQNEVQGTSTDQQKAMDRLLRKSTAQLFAKIRVCTTTQSTERDGGAGSDKDAADALALLDKENQQLQTEVIEAAGRVAQLRTTVPEALSNRFKGMLESCRPSPPAEGVEAAQTNSPEAGAAEAANAPMSPAPLELQDKFAAVTDGIPSLRAELEEALERLQRIVAAIDSEAEKAPPNTVEKAFKPSFDSPAASGMPSPKLADAVSSGKIVTRRRMASHLRPIPYPMR